MSCEQLKVQEYIDLIRLNPNAKGFDTEALCEDECGLCCVPVCSVTPYGGGGDIDGYDEQNLGFITCGAAHVSFGIVESTSLTAPGNIYLPTGGTKPYPWKSGFPAALSGYSYWRWVSSHYVVGFGGDSFADGDPFCRFNADPNYSPPPGLPGSYQAEQIYSPEAKWALFACVDGALVDITTDALDTSEMVSRRQPPEPDPCNAYALGEENILDYKSSRSYFYSPSGDVFTDGPLSGCYGGWVWGGTYTVQPRTLVNTAGDTFMVPSKRPPLPNEPGAQGITYSCDGSVGRAACEGGGLLNLPALGIWHPGEECPTFDCNA